MAAVLACGGRAAAKSEAGLRAFEDSATPVAAMVLSRARATRFETALTAAAA